jgi:hypothetical protein
MTKAAGQTSNHRLPAVMVRRHATVTTHRLVDRMVAAKTEAGSTSSRLAPEMIGHLRSLIDRIQVHNRPEIAAGGSASLPADVRTIALAVAEMRVAENRSWNSTSLLSRRATRLLKAAILGDTTVATMAVWTGEIAAVAMIAATAVAVWAVATTVEAMIAARPVAALAAVDMIAAHPVAALAVVVMIVARPVAALAAVAMIEAATAAAVLAVAIAETAAVAAEGIAGVAEVGTKAEEENLPAPGLVRASADAM